MCNRHEILCVAPGVVGRVHAAMSHQMFDVAFVYSVHVRTRKLRTSETPLRSWSTRKPVFGFSRGRSIYLVNVLVRTARDLAKKHGISFTNKADRNLFLDLGFRGSPGLFNAAGWAVLRPLCCIQGAK